jgi:FkbM family methyltransferase
LINPYFSISKRLLRLRHKPLVAKRRGALWLLFPNDWIDNRLLIGRPFEREQLSYAEQCINVHKLDYCFDCGSNFGLYSVTLGMKVERLEEMHAFEPVAKTWGRLVSNITLNNLNAKITAHNYGLGEKEETLTIVINPSSSGTASLKTSEEQTITPTYIEQKVQIFRFDDKFDQTGQRSFFKIDLEGHEKYALNGMKTYLANNQCILQVEQWKENRNIIHDLLKEFGYKKFHAINEDFYFSNFI